MNRNLVLIFVIALTIRIWFNFFDTHANAAFAFDAAEYLRDAQNLDLTLHKLFFEQSNYLWLSAKALIGLASIDEMNRIKEVFISVREMSISGPVFPSFLLACYKICGQVPCADMWCVPIAFQCLLSALTCVLIAAIGSTCWDKSTGLIAGLLAACYPGFVVNSGRLYSESFACFLICLTIWLVCNYWIKDKRDYKWGFLLGVCLFALQVTRSIMTGLSIAILVLFILSALLMVKRKRMIIKYLLAMIIGFCFCLLPWLFLQKLAYGKTSFIVDRRSSYNLYIGNDVDGLGWLRVPYPDCRNIDQAKPWDIINQAIKKSPQRWLKLMLDKPVRLLKLPWNDFKSSIGIVSYGDQAIFHQLILVFAVIGLIISNMDAGQNYKQAKNIARSIILITLLMHSIYLLFDTLPRYALTAMPELIIFAGAGIAAVLNAFQFRQNIFVAVRLLFAAAVLMIFSQVNIVRLIMQFNGSNFMLIKIAFYIGILLKLIVAGLFFIACGQLMLKLWQRNRDYHYLLRRNYALLTLVFLAILTLPAYGLPLRAHGRWYEWSQDLDKSDGQIEQTIRIKRTLLDRLFKSGAYLALNLCGGSDLCINGNISINGVRLSGPFIPMMAIDQDLSLITRRPGNQLILEQEFIFKCLADMSSKDLVDLRQWYLIPVSGNQLEKIVSAVANPNHGQGSIVLHVVLQKSTGGQCTAYGAYPIDSHFFMIPSLYRFSWEKTFYGVENSSGASDPAYDDRVELNRLSAGKGACLAGAYIRLLVPENIGSEDNRAAKINKDDYSMGMPLRIIDKEYKEVNLKTESMLLFKLAENKLSESKPSGYWLVRLQGTVEHSGAKELVQSVNVLFSTNLDKGKARNSLSYGSPWLPTYIKLNSPTDAQSDLREKLLNNQSNLNFDYCFPIMPSAFPGHPEAIQLRLVNNKNGILRKEEDARLKDARLRCCLEIYQVNEPIPGAHCEIF